QRGAGMGQTLDHELAEIGLGAGARQESNLDNPTIHSGDRIVRIDVSAADHVENDVDALATCVLLEHSHEVFIAIVDGASGTKIEACLAFFFGAGCCENAGAEGHSQLYGRSADA